MKNEPDIVKKLREEEKNNLLETSKYNEKPEFIKKIQRKILIKELEKEIENIFYFNKLNEKSNQIDEKKSLYLSDTEENNIFKKENSNNLKINYKTNIKNNYYKYLDDIDDTILYLININPYITPSKISKILKLSRTAIIYRIDELQRLGIVKKFYFKTKKK